MSKKKKNIELIVPESGNLSSDVVIEKQLRLSRAGNSLSDNLRYSIMNSLTDSLGYSLSNRLKQSVLSIKETNDA